VNRLRVLVVDDSVVIRKLLSGALSEQADIEVIGTAPTGRIALSKIRQLDPDLVTLDLDMPDMDGMETLDALKEFPRRPKIILCSSLTTKDGALTLEALAKGASDYITKPSGLGGSASPFEEFRCNLLAKVRALGVSGSPTATMSPNGASRPALNPHPFGASARQDRKRIELVAIGVSTGGPNALSALFAELPADFPVPIVLVQHMPPIFTKSLADRLTAKSRIRVDEGSEGAILAPGRAWVAPGDFHMQVARHDSVMRLRLNKEAPENSCRPAVDVLFRSVAENFGSGTLAVVLTGMGQDGLKGSQCIRDAGGEIYVQDEASSVVWGMPGQVAKAGLADRVLPLDLMAMAIWERVSWGRPLIPGKS
jgi:two-component system, chemotaxis family, protein-glutamate methylesterase/glutaminase